MPILAASRRLLCLSFLTLPWLAIACGDDGGSPSNGLGANGANGIPAIRELGCKDPVPSAGGFERCANGVLHRREIAACPDARSNDVPCNGMFGSDPARGEVTCTRDACGPLASPTCVQGQSSGAYQPPSCRCQGNCLADSDCGAGNVCACGGGTGSCVPAGGCTSDAACNGGACLQVVVLPADGCVSPVTTFACTTPDDICDDDADCGGAPGVACRLDGAVRKCVRLPTPCCQGDNCGKQCWDASDCGGTACVEASTTYCTSFGSIEQPKAKQCATPGGTCTKDADCKGEAGESCLWDGKKHTCSRPPPGCLPV